MSKDLEDSNAPYLPERYKRHVEAKKRRRLFKRVITACVMIMVVTGLYLAVSGTLFGLLPNPLTGNAVSPLPSLTPSQTPITSPSSSPLPTSRTPAISSTVTPAITPSPSSTPGLPVLENPRITEDRAQNIVLTTFPTIHANRVTVQYREHPEFGEVWDFALYQNTTMLIIGSLDPATGRILSFARTIPLEGRRAAPVLSVTAAQKIADRYIADRNGPLALNMSAYRYIAAGTLEEPVAGSYSFTYNRIVQDIPCDWEGFTVDVDSMTGEVTEYIQRWGTPDNAFALAEDPLVARYEATYAVLHRAQEIYPSSISGLHIISAEIRWKDRHPPGSFPRPGSIPLAWKVQFDDDAIWTKQSLEPAFGWVDTQTGDLLDFNYQH